MRIFVRLTFLVAVVLAALVMFVFLLKLLVVAAVIAAFAIVGARVARALGFRLGSRRRWVTALTARR